MRKLNRLTITIHLPFESFIAIILELKGDF
ncbi:uncharacterized protein METZ01_LOCUS90839 [marine metagenome]|uniref:Uncharacterized protein n=1 Tax=marine metagenome TaxID=408172 RepID=A0A381VC87_9ZZZZ